MFRVPRFVFRLLFLKNGVSIYLTERKALSGQVDPGKSEPMPQISPKPLERRCSNMRTSLSLYENVAVFRKDL